MRAQPSWRTQPIFVTSTFRDTHAERDWLRHHVFPELEERLRARRCHLEPIDLRWGVDPSDAAGEAARQLLVLKVCLAEVARSRPFLIGILGDRYGWVPPPERMEAAAREAGFEKPVAGRSVTDLEIDYGVLSDPAQRQRCFFYLRDPLPYDAMRPELAALYSEAHRREPDAAEAARHLSALEARLEAELPGRVRHYAATWDAAGERVVGLEAWGKQVLDDLWRELDAELPAADRAPSWQEEERFALDQLLERHARGFVGREALLGELRGLALSPAAESAAWGACVTAPAGAGKSALFAALLRALQSEDALVLAHAAGASPRATSVDALLRRFAEELAEQLGEPTGIEETSNAEQVEEAFQSLLGRTSARRRVVLLLDALDQFEPTTRAEHVTWLPRLWPPNVRLVATAIPGTASAALCERPAVRSLPLGPLGEAEARAIAQSICERYHRTLNQSVIDALIAKRAEGGTAAAGNPLWLELALEELNLLDADDFARMERDFAGDPLPLLLAVVAEMPAEIEPLYGWLLKRAEELHGEAWARGFVDLIAVSRAGWRERDFQELMPRLTGEAWDPLRVAALRRTFRGHVLEKGASGQWDFAHAQLRRSVLGRPRAEAAVRRVVHARVAEHLLSLPSDDPLHVSESMFHLLGAGDAEPAALYYGGALSDEEAVGATAVIADLLEAGAADRTEQRRLALSLPDVEAHDPGIGAAICSRFLFELNERLERAAGLSTRHEAANAAQRRLSALVAEDPSNAGWQRDLSVSHAKIGNVLTAQGDLGGALEAYRAGLGIAERLAAADPRNAGWQRDLSVSHNNIGDVLTAQGDLGGALEAYRAGLGIRERLAAADPRNAGWQRDLSVSHNNIGDVLTAQGDLGRALEAYRAGLGIAERLAAADPRNAGWQRDLSVSHNNIGDVLTAQGDLGGALEAYRAGLGIAERLAAADPRNAGWQRDLSVSHGKIGDVLTAQGDLGGALEAYRAGLGIAERLAAADPRNAGWQRDLSVRHNNIGDVLTAQGDLGGALEAYRAGLGIRERLAAADPRNAGWQRDLSVSHNNIGDVLTAQGDLGGALEAYRAGLGIRERLAAADPRNAGWQRDLSVSHNNIGDVLTAQGDLGGALEAYRAGLGIAERLAAADPRNAGWQRDLAYSYVMIGDTLSSMHAQDGALGAYEAAFPISEGLAALDPSNVMWQNDVTVLRRKVTEARLAAGDLASALRAVAPGLLAGRSGSDGSGADSAREEPPAVERSEPQSTDGRSLMRRLLQFLGIRRE